MGEHLAKHLRTISCLKFQFGDLNVLMMSLNAKLSHVNKGLGLGGRVGKQQRGRGGEGTDRYEFLETVTLHRDPSANVVRST